jgi:hypothetical protein
LFFSLHESASVLNPQVEEFAKLSFEKNEERKEKPVYISVDDGKSNVRNWFTKLLISLC